jgi:hypothetical protein
MNWIMSFGKTKWAQYKGITIEGVSGLGSIAKLLRGEVLSVF